MRNVLRLAPLLLLLPTTQAFAKETGEFLSDVRDYVLSPFHWDRSDWILAGEAAAATAAAYSIDSRVRHELAPSHSTVHGDPSSLRDSAPMAAMVVGVFAVGLFTGNTDLEVTSRDMTEAVVLGSTTAFALKYAFGRTRPDATMDKSSWRSGGDSFPSGHTAAAFAAAQVLADSRPPGEWPLRVAAYTLGGLTAYARLDGNMHWFSDTVAGAALGMAVGRFISSRSRDGSGAASTRFEVQPLHGGALLSFSVDLHSLVEH